MTLPAILIIVMVVFALLTFVGFPGPLATALVVLAYSANTGFTAISWSTLTIFLLIGVFGLVIDNIFALLGAKKFGASKKGIIGALLGLTLVFMVGPLGLFIGPPLGAFIAEYVLNKKTKEEAARAALGVVVGAITGIAAKVLITFALIIWFGIIVF